MRILMICYVTSDPVSTATHVSESPLIGSHYCDCGVEVTNQDTCESCSMYLCFAERLVPLLDRTIMQMGYPMNTMQI